MGQAPDAEREQKRVQRQVHKSERFEQVKALLSQGVSRDPRLPLSSAYQSAPSIAGEGKRIVLPISLNPKSERNG